MRLLKTVRNFLCEKMGITALPRLVHKTLFRDHLLILAYHGVVEAPAGMADWCVIGLTAFRQQLLYLQHHFDILPLHEAVWKWQQHSLRRATAIITFDDGFQNNFDYAFPVLNELGLPATIFLSTSFIGTDDTIWFCRLNRAIEGSVLHYFRWRGLRFDISTVARREETSRILMARLKQLSHPELEKEVDTVVECLGVPGRSPVPLTSPYRMLDATSIKKMQDSGLLTFGAHSHSHAVLSLLSVAEQERELALSLGRVKELTGRSCNIFAYPNGRHHDYTQQTLELLKKNGVCTAVTISGGLNRPGTSSLELSRVGIGGNWRMGLFQFAVHLPFNK